MIKARVAFIYCTFQYTFSSAPLLEPTLVQLNCMNDLLCWWHSRYSRNSHSLPYSTGYIQRISTIWQHGNSSKRKIFILLLFDCTMPFICLLLATGKPIIWFAKKGETKLYSVYSLKKIVSLIVCILFAVQSFVCVVVIVLSTNFGWNELAISWVLSAPSHTHRWRFLFVNSLSGSTIMIVHRRSLFY